MSWASGDASSRAFSRDERLDHLRVDHRSALGHGADRRRELLDVVHALLQQIRATRGPALEERERIARLRIGAEHDDAELRSRLAKPEGGLDALVGPVRRHPNVGDDDVWVLGLDGGEQRSEVAARCNDFEVRLRLEQTPDTLANEVVVFRQHQAYRHGDQHMTP